MVYSPERRVGCMYCAYVGPASSWLSAPNPFDPKDTLDGCPECKSAESTVQLCSTSNCQAEASSGRVTVPGYVYYCNKHYPKESA